MYYLIIKFLLAGSVLGYAWTPTPFHSKDDCEANATKLAEEVYADLEARKALPEGEIEVQTLCSTELPK